MKAIKYSAHYYNSLLRRWAKRKKVNLGEESGAGYALYIRPRGSLMEFVISGRNSECCKGMLTFTFIKNTPPHGEMDSKTKEICRRISVKSRRKAFKEVSRIFLKI